MGYNEGDQCKTLSLHCEGNAASTSGVFLLGEDYRRLNKEAIVLAR